MIEAGQNLQDYVRQKLLGNTKQITNKKAPKAGTNKH